MMQRRVLIAAFLAATAFFSAHVINVMIAHTLTRSVALRQASVKTEKGLPAKVNRLRLSEEILASGMFGGSGIGVEKVSLRMKTGDLSGDTRALASIGPPIDAAKKVKLVGTVVGDGKVSMAVVEEISTKKQTLYHLHDVIVNVGQIAQVRKDAILIRQGARHEVLALASVVSVFAPHDHTTSISEAVSSQ